MHTKKIQWPRINDVLEDLVEIRDFIRSHDISDTDVRLQVETTQYHNNGDFLNTSWQVHSGDASYDQNHYGYWGSGVVSSDMSKATLRDIAHDLIEQAKDHEAMSV
jgi:hypothetical protein